MIMPEIMPENNDEPETDAVATPSAEPSAEAMVRALQSLLEVKEQEVANLKDQSLRALAEVENTRRRFEREQADTTKYAVTSFARDLVHVVENLQRACDAIDSDARASQPALESIAVGVEMTMKDLLSSFEKHGIIRIDPIGAKFDHNLHQAVSQVPSPDTPAGTIIQVLQAGYKIHDRLLRPAMVVVASDTADAGERVDTRA